MSLDEIKLHQLERDLEETEIALRALRNRTLEVLSNLAMSDEDGEPCFCIELDDDRYKTRKGLHQSYCVNAVKLLKELGWKGFPA